MSQLELEQVFCSVRMGQNYLLPLVDLEESGKRAREKIWRHRNTSEVKAEGKRIVATHTRGR